MSKVNLVLANQASELQKILSSVSEELIILSPWIKNLGVKLVLNYIDASKIKLDLFTRINLSDFIRGASDSEAINMLFNNFKNFNLRTIPNLHAKVYIADNHRALTLSVLGTKYIEEKGMNHWVAVRREA